MNITGKDLINFKIFEGLNNKDVEIFSPLIKVEKVSNQKKEIITAPTIITTNQQPQKLFSTYKGTKNQNFQLLTTHAVWNLASCHLSFKDLKLK